jgi:chromosome segregation ATPase
MNDNNAEDELVKRTGVLSITTPAEHAAEIAHLKAMLEGSQAKNNRLEKEAKKREKKVKDLKKEKRELEKEVTTLDNENRGYQADSVAQGNELEDMKDQVRELKVALSGLNEEHKNLRKKFGVFNLDDEILELATEDDDVASEDIGSKVATSGAPDDKDVAAKASEDAHMEDMAM